MTILHLSDTHGKHCELPPLPEADVIVHSGDFTFGGSEGEAYDFLNWFCDLPYRHKIFVAGNHDMCMYGNDSIEGLPENVHYLNNTRVEIEGVKFFGIPMFLDDFMDGSLDEMTKAIPANTEVLITHQPPFGYCDEWCGQHCGDKILREKVESLPALKCHLFGHQHEAKNVVKTDSVLLSNAAALDAQYNMVENPFILLQLQPDALRVR